MRTLPAAQRQSRLNPRHYAASIIQQRDALGRRWLRLRLQERVDVGQILVRDHFTGVRRHLPGGLPHILRESRKGYRARSQPRSRPQTALGLTAMALVAPIVVKKLLAFLSAAPRRRSLRR